MSDLRVSSAGLLARVSGESFRQVCHEHYRWLTTVGGHTTHDVVLLNDSIVLHGQR